MGGEGDMDQRWVVLGEGEEKAPLPSRSPSVRERQEWRGTMTPRAVVGSSGGCGHPEEALGLARGLGHPGRSFY